ncbi:MAG TPA: RNA polymerase sigma factor SigJ [Woeseiaceae bacterium]|nr:RNA polymerase sigma factor SigJ [Woeseiaceae bacterium]
MHTRTDRGAVFEENRRKLWRIAYRMLGSQDEAEDMVQEAYLRWHRTPAESVRSPQAWLVTTVTRLSIDRLRQLRAERALYTGPWLPEPLVGEAAPAADRPAELASELSVALLAVLERLAPEERAAFLLHEVFDAGYDDISVILGKSEAACRQIVSRAAKRVRAERPRVAVNPTAARHLLKTFADAVRAQDKDTLLGIFAEEATWTSDGGGKAKAALKVIHGAERIARFATGVFRNAVGRLEFRVVSVNGEPGLAALVDGQLVSIVSIRTDGQRILDVYAILNPEKLRRAQVSPVQIA